MTFSKKELKQLSTFRAITPIARRLGISRLWVRKVVAGQTKMTTTMQKAIMKEAREYLSWLNERKSKESV